MSQHKKGKLKSTTADISTHSFNVYMHTVYCGLSGAVLWHCGSFLPTTFYLINDSNYPNCYHSSVFQYVLISKFFYVEFQKTVWRNQKKPTESYRFRYWLNLSIKVNSSSWHKKWCRLIFKKIFYKKSA